MITDGTFLATANGELAPVINFAQGYFVALEGLETRVGKRASDVPFLEEIKEVYRLLSLRYNAYVGIWTTAEHVYFDLSEWIENEKDAIQIGKRRGQLAIWDIANSVALDVTQFPFIVERNGRRGISNLSLATAQALVDGAELKERNGNGKD